MAPEAMLAVLNELTNEPEPVAPEPESNVIFAKVFDWCFDIEKGASDLRPRYMFLGYGDRWSLIRE